MVDTLHVAIYNDKNLLPLYAQVFIGKTFAKSLFSTPSALTLISSVASSASMPMLSQEQYSCQFYDSCQFYESVAMHCQEILYKKYDTQFTIRSELLKVIEQQARETTKHNCDTTPQLFNFTVDIVFEERIPLIVKYEALRDRTNNAYAPLSQLIRNTQNSIGMYQLNLTHTLVINEHGNLILDFQLKKNQTRPFIYAKDSHGLIALNELYINLYFDKEENTNNFDTTIEQLLCKQKNEYTTHFTHTQLQVKDMRKYIKQRTVTKQLFEFLFIIRRKFNQPIPNILNEYMQKLQNLQILSEQQYSLSKQSKDKYVKKPKISNLYKKDSKDQKKLAKK